MLSSKDKSDVMTSFPQMVGRDEGSSGGADAQPALVSDQAPAGLDPSGFDPSRGEIA
jgi:hypothetical protein